MNDNKTTKLCGLYARVSTTKQEEEATIESQINEIKERVERDGNILPTENIFIDNGWTGEMLQRPALDLMRDAAKDGRFQILYVYDRGRVSRVFFHQEIILEELREKEIEFISLHDLNAITPEDRVLQGMQGLFAEYERIKIAERMRRGKLYKARSGVLINGSALYGYNYIKKTDSKPAHYVINKEEARVVKMIYEWVGNERISLREVIRRLFDMGISPRKERSDFWTKGPIVRMLRCEAYTKGIIYYNKSEAVVAKNPIKIEKYKKIKRNSRKVRPREEWIPYTVPTIIEDSFLYQKVQKILDFNQKYACKKRRYDYLLSGLAFCECGSPRVGDGSDGKNFYYRCAQRIYKFPHENKCKIKGMNAMVLDQTIWRELVEFLQHTSEIKKYAEEWLRTQTNNELDKKEKVRLDIVLNKIKEEKQRYAKAYGEGTLEFEQFKDLTKDVKKRELLYQKQIDALNNKITREGIDESQLEELVKEAKKVILRLDLSNKIQVIRDIIDRCIVKGGNTVEVWGHLPLFAVNMGYEPISRNSRAS